MPLADTSYFVVVCAAFLTAGLVKGVVGMGLPTVVMGILGLFLPVAQAAVLLTLPSLVTNVWQAAVGGAFRALLLRLGGMFLGIFVGVALAAWLLPPDDRLGRRLLGACLLAYGLLGFAGWRPGAPRHEGIVGPVVGLATGLLTSLTGVFVLPMVPYLQSLQLDRRELSQALGLSFCTSTLALGALLVTRSQLDAQGAMHSALAIVPALVGMFVGQKLRDVMSEAMFRNCFLAGMVLLGAWLALR
ncbi:MAG TPA: sulfite exporter TauE/SafE family protein [Ramlibacter sp.]|jgi:hypothetical protein|nr:sulfite exporter TauE/SafE family protein [Ramlibacter sp.]